MGKEKQQTYLQVIEYIHQQVESGQLQRGDKLPTERQLVEILGIGRNSIREALKIMDTLGILDRRQGAGTYICETFDNWFTEPMSIAFMLSDTSKKEIFEFRNMIEVEIATLAAKRITEEEIEALRDCYRNLVEIQDEVISTQYDKEFHGVLAKASKNMVIINAYNAMDYMLDQFIYSIRAEVFEKEGRDLVVSIHKELFEAVAARNEKQARKAMKKHMDVVRRHFN